MNRPVKTLGPKHPNIAVALNDPAEVYDRQERYPEAEALYRKSFVCQDVALLCAKLSKYSDVESNPQQALDIRERRTRFECGHDVGRKRALIVMTRIALRSFFVTLSILSDRPVSSDSLHGTKQRSRFSNPTTIAANGDK